MAVSTFRHRKFTTVAAGDLSHAYRGFETTTVNENNHPCIMKVDFDHEHSKVVIRVEEWDQDSIRLVDRRQWVFTPTSIESSFWGLSPDGSLVEEPYVTLYPSEFSIAYSSGGRVFGVVDDLNKMDCRPALEHFAHRHYPHPENKSIVQVEFDAQGGIVFNVYPVRSAAEAGIAAMDRKETTEAWFKALLAKGQAFA
jgi:hypothetical protein